MESPKEETRSLLADRPDYESYLEEIVELDGEGPWEFDDLSFDSGTFGQIASHNFIEKTGDGYQLADREQIASALSEFQANSQDSPQSNPDSTSQNSETPIPHFPTPSLEGTNFQSLRTTLTNPTLQFPAAILSILTGLIAIRITSYDGIFRDEGIFFPVNDAYAYRYAVDSLHSSGVGPFSFSEMATSMGGRATSEPLVVVLGYWASAIFGSSPETTGRVLAWLPVGAAVVLGLLVAILAFLLTDDQRIAILSVGALAVTPAHGLYTGLAFFDHHAFDYVWLAVIVIAIVWINRDFEQRLSENQRLSDTRSSQTDNQETRITVQLLPGLQPTAIPDSLLNHLRAHGVWASGVLLGVGVAGAVLTWDGSPLLLLGIVVYAPLRVLADIRRDVTPLGTNAPVFAGLALGTIFTLVPHLLAGFQERPVVLAPAIVMLGFVGLATVGEYWRQTNRSLKSFGYVIGAGLVATITLFIARIGPFAWFSERAWQVIAREGPAETRQLLTLDTGVWFGLADTYGLLVFVFVPMLVWASFECYRRYEPRWLVMVSFGWVLFGLSLIQIRFAGEASVVTSVFAGTGIIAFLARMEFLSPTQLFGTRHPIQFQLRPRSIPITHSAIIIACLLVLAVPGAMATTDMVGSGTHEEAHVQAADWIASDAAEKEGDQYVFTFWPENRMYNYMSSGWAASFNYSQWNYGEFIQSDSPDEYYTEFDGKVTDIPERFDGEVEYIVLQAGADFPPETTYSTLFERLGGAMQTDDGRLIDGTGHYRFVFGADIEPSAVLVFEVVPGATIEATGPPESEFFVHTDLSTEFGDIRYNRLIETDATGEYSVTVAYPGTYVLDEGTTVEISEEAVETGETIRVD